MHTAIQISLQYNLIIAHTAIQVSLQYNLIIAHLNASILIASKSSEVYGASQY